MPSLAAVLGLAGAWVGNRLLQSHLFEIGGDDPILVERFGWIHMLIVRYSKVAAGTPIALPASRDANTAPVEASDRIRPFFP